MKCLDVKCNTIYNTLKYRVVCGVVWCGVEKCNVGK